MRNSLRTLRFFAHFARKPNIVKQKYFISHKDRKEIKPRKVREDVFCKNTKTQKMTQYDLLPDSTRVWIYQSNRSFSDTEIEQLRTAINRFTTQWVSHNQQLRAFGNIFHNQFIVLMVDESLAGASGCSIDKSVYFIKKIENDFKINLFDRMNFTFKDGNEIKMAQRDDFAKLFSEGKITNETIVFDNLVKTKKDFDEAWLKPLSQSWHKRMV